MSDSPDRKPGSALTAESFRVLLDWLDPDVERAALKYENIRHGLITMFANRRCTDAEGLADETIDRVARKLPKIRLNYQGDPTRYFYGVAMNLHRELTRKKLAAPLPPPPTAADAVETERMFECLSKCLGTLSPVNRDLILHYYAEQKRAKINTRRELALELGMQSNALRARVHRIRSAIHKCMEECVRAREE